MSEEVKLMPVILSRLPEKVDHPCWNALSTISPPSSKQELWRYTRTARIIQHAWKLSDNHETDSSSGINGGAGRIVIVNGNYCEERTLLPKGVSIAASNEFYHPHNPTHFFEALSFVYCTCVLDIIVDHHTNIEDVIHIEYHHTNDDGFSAPVIRIHAGAHSQVKFAEHFSETSSTCLHIRNLEVKAEASSKVHIDKIQSGGTNSFVMNEDRIVLESGAEFRINTMTVSGNWTRNMLHISLMGSGAVAHLNGFYAPCNSEFIDNHTCVYHAVPHCESHELYKGLLSDTSTGVFNGRIHVEKDAQKTNAYQSNANLLSGAEAKMYTKPELEIYADDVKCSHGSTTGQIDEEALFYLKARGLSHERASQLLSEAFFAEIIEGCTNAEVATHVVKQLAKRGIVHPD
ncbi:MAG: Fe-S cluster assembly protein SufD [Flavobacteriales bacterium]